MPEKPTGGSRACLARAAAAVLPDRGGGRVPSPAMAWVKIPPDNHPLFLAALPRDPRVSTLRMFGGIAAKANGYMFGGLFARSIIVRLSPEDRRAALALDGTAPFDPMGSGRVMTDTLLLAESVMDEPGELRGWLARAFAHIVSLPARPAAAKRAGGKRAQAKPAAASRPTAAQRAQAKPTAGTRPAAAHRAPAKRVAPAAKPRRQR
jgi:TfoX/Sxy family transcriptional regulator of competence genes